MKVRLTRPVKISIELVVLALLVLLFVLVLDPRQLHKYIELITPQVVTGILTFQLAILVTQTFHWTLILREAGIYRGFWWTFFARVGGFAVTYLMPSMYFGGEPVRASLYKDRFMSYEKVYASIALDKYIELGAKIPFIIAGFSLLVYFVHTGTALLLVSGTILLAFIGFFLFLIVKLFSSRTFIVTAFKQPLRIVARVNPRFAAKALRSIRQFARDVSEIIRRRRIFYVALAAGVLVAFVEVLQTYYLLFVLGHPSLPNSIVIFSTVVVQSLIGLLPGNIGGMEGTHLFIFNILRIGSNASFVYTLILRMGQMCMVLLGLGFILLWRVEKVRIRGADRNRTDV
ncbi:MAG TPA: flippase-like domain-containing protein [Spirochaetia bacterium]|nr:flippase-like domain-containing protein [Spirochaetia bacterium]